MNVRYVCASAAAALGFACSSTSFARVLVSYVPTTVVYFPPRPAHSYVPPLAHIVPVVPPVMGPVEVPVKVTAPVPSDAVAKPARVVRTVVVPAPTNYAIEPEQRVVYAQPVMAVPYRHEC